MKTRHLFLVNAILMSSFMFGLTQPTTDTLATARENAHDFLKILDKKYQEVRFVYGKFDQVKVSLLFMDEIYTKGEFFFKKPGYFRCDHFKPNESFTYIVDDVSYLYIPEINQVDKFHFDKNESEINKLNQMLLGFGAKVEDVEEVYEIRAPDAGETPTFIQIDFIPRESEEETSFDTITIWFNKQSLLPTKLLIREENGDKTTIDFDMKKFDLNTTIKDEVFIPRFPRDVEIIERY